MDNNEEFTRHRCAAAPGHECLSDPSSLNNPNQYDDNGDDQQNVDKSAHGVRRNQSQRPQDNKYDCNGAEHDDDLLFCFFSCLNAICRQMARVHAAIREILCGNAPNLP